MTHRSDVTGTAVPIDPRMRERRAAVDRARLRRRWGALAGAAAVVSVGVAGFAVLHTPLVSARRVLAVGNRHETLSALLAAAGLSRREPLVDVDTRSAAARIGRLPWVARATVRRTWPSAVVIDVVERTAVAQVPVAADGRMSGPVALVDASGRVLDRQAARSRALPLVTGVERPGRPGSFLAGGTTRAALDVARTLGHLPPPTGTAVGAKVSRVDVDRTGSLTAVIEPSGARLLLGSDGALGAKVRAAEVLLGRVKVAAGAVVDVQVPDRPTVSPAPRGPDASGRGRPGRHLIEAAP